MNKEHGKRQIRLRSIPPQTSPDKMKKMEGLYGFHLRLGGGEPAKLEWFGEQEKAEETFKEEKEKISLMHSLSFQQKLKEFFEAFFVY